MVVTRPLHADGLWRYGDRGVGLAAIACLRASPPTRPAGTTVTVLRFEIAAIKILSGENALSLISPHHHLELAKYAFQAKSDRASLIRRFFLGL